MAFPLIDSPQFDVQAGSAEIVEVVIRTHTKATSTPKFFHKLLKEAYKRMHERGNGSRYVARRLCTEILFTYLTRRQNLPLMMRYVQSTKHLQILIQLLLEGRTDPSSIAVPLSPSSSSSLSSSSLLSSPFSLAVRRAQLNLLKLFLADPGRKPDIQALLAQNKDKLMFVIKSTTSHQKPEGKKEEIEESKAESVAASKKVAWMISALEASCSLHKIRITGGKAPLKKRGGNQATQDLCEEERDEEQNVAYEDDVIDADIDSNTTDGSVAASCDENRGVEAPVHIVVGGSAANRVNSNGKIVIKDTVKQTPSGDTRDNMSDLKTTINS